MYVCVCVCVCAILDKIDNVKNAGNDECAYESQTARGCSSTTRPNKKRQKLETKIMKNNSQAYQNSTRFKTN